MRYLVLMFMMLGQSFMAKAAPTPQMIAGIIDHTYLKTEGEGVSLNEQREEVRKLVHEAHKYGAYSVCVREHMVSYARQILDKLHSSVKLTSVIGFPLGDQYTTAQKVELVEKARRDGADEYDMVLRYVDFKAGRTAEAFRDVLEVSNAVGDQVLKVIIENSYLTEDQRLKAYQLVMEAFQNSQQNTRSPMEKRFLKTSTGFAKPAPGIPVGATLADVETMHKVAKGRVGIKPAGGVGSYEEAIRFFEAVGSPYTAGGEKIDAMRFRIGSSSLLSKLMSTAPHSQGDY